MSRVLRPLLLAAAATTLLMATPAAADEPTTATAQVYLDANGNGERDRGEKPVEGTSVWWCPPDEDPAYTDRCVERTTDRTGTSTYPSADGESWTPYVDVDGSSKWVMQSYSDDGQGSYLIGVNDEEVEDSRTYATTGTVYHDEDRDDTMDAGEERLSGIELVACHREKPDDCLDPVRTDAQGRFDYGEVPRTHEVRAQPATERGLQPVTSDWSYDDDTMTADYTIGMAAVKGVRHRGLIYWDQDQDGTRERPEPGVRGVTVTACTESGDCIARVQTDEYGCYDLGKINETHIVEVDPDLSYDTSSVTSTEDGNFEEWAALGDDLVDVSTAPAWVENPCGVGSGQDDPQRPTVVQTDGGPLGR